MSLRIVIHSMVDIRQKPASGQGDSQEPVRPYMVVENTKPAAQDMPEEDLQPNEEKRKLEVSAGYFSVTL